MARAMQPGIPWGLVGYNANGGQWEEQYKTM